MTLMKWRNGLPSMFDDFFNDSFGENFGLTNQGKTIPAVNVKEDKDNFSVELAAPGMKKDDFDINLEHNVLTISSEKKDENEEKKDNYTRREFSYQSFSRSFTLPESVNIDKIEAKYEDGVLRLNLPKLDEAKLKETKRIAVK